MKNPEWARVSKNRYDVDYADHTEDEFVVRELLAAVDLQPEIPKQ